MVCDLPRPQWPTLHLSGWIQAGNRCGISVVQVFEGLGIQVTGHPASGLRLPPASLLSALQRCVDRAVGDHFALALGESLANAYGPMADAYLATSPTPRDALRLLGPAMHPSMPWLTVRLEETADEAWIGCEGPAGCPPDPLFQPVIETALCAIHRLVLPLLGQDAALRAVHFRHAALRHADHHHRHFGIAPRFGQLRNALFFDRAFLDRRLPGGSVDLHRAAQMALGAQARTGEAVASVSAQVEQLLRGQPHLLHHGLPALALHMALTPRSLQRRLAKEGHVFSELLNRVRCDMAMRWLTDPARDINRVSEWLGYRDRRAFTSAFKKWTGLAPTQYRARARARGPNHEADPAASRPGVPPDPS